MEAWVTSTHVAGDGMMVAEMIVRVRPDGDLAMHLSDAQADHQAVEVAFPGHEEG